MTTETDDQITTEGLIVSKDDDQRLVFGWANIATNEDGHVVVDRQGDWTTVDELEKAAYDYVLNSRDGGVQHLTKGVATVVESMVFTKDKLSKLGIPEGTVPEGWWIGFRIHDDDVWAGVKKGDYPDFSIHGSGRRTKKAPTGVVSTPVAKASLTTIAWKRYLLSKREIGKPVTPLEQMQREEAGQNSANKRKKGVGGGNSAKAPADTELTDEGKDFLRAMNELDPKDRMSMLALFDSLDSGEPFRGVDDEQHEKFLKALKEVATDLVVEEDGSGTAELQDGRTLSIDASPGESAWSKDGKRTKSR